ncbi:aminotransferase class I and II [Spirochaeta thermophila DSM 6578]|uniref:Aminotransferase class I and II n=1 Tax=Winmispira thermophila (strain ATCC 700085 / DSM 6578 / Z-1203) TaxID=869211 RepID=G0GBM7_WINT7|nr:8-amino-7-oxononanoate synthase [Spirochaeta thermophila]AEJ61105.1 aminotransferase class I and II [Spirochaeta thermophila DSM 6578]
MLSDKWESIRRELISSSRFRTCESLRQEGKYVFWNGQKLLHLSSNDYLGIGTDLALQHQFLSEQLNNAESAGRCLGEGGSRLLCGNTASIEKAEKTWCGWLGKEKALLFSSGYHANVALFSVLGELNATVFLDEECHASMFDGLRIGRTRFYRFRHNDPHHLENLLSRYGHKGEQAVIATEGIFSMEGDTPPLPALCELKNRFGALLVVDEAHALGVIGPQGRGAAAEEKLDTWVDVVIGTGGKALGASGGVVGGPQWLIEALINRGRSLIYTTGIPPLLAEWHAWIIPKIQAMEEQRIHATRLTSLLQSALQRKGIPVRGGKGCLLAAIAGPDPKAVEWAKHLRASGFFVHPIRPPTVPPGTSRIRFSITALMSQKDILHLADVCGTLMEL